MISKRILKKVKKLFKKVLTKADRYDNLLKLSLETEQRKNLDN